MPDVESLCQFKDPKNPVIPERLLEASLPDEVVHKSVPNLFNHPTHSMDSQFRERFLGQHVFPLMERASRTPMASSSMFTCITPKNAGESLVAPQVMSYCCFCLSSYMTARNATRYCQGQDLLHGTTEERCPVCQPDNDGLTVARQIHDVFEGIARELRLLTKGDAPNGVTLWTFRGLRHLGENCEAYRSIPVDLVYSLLGDDEERAQRAWNRLLSAFSCTHGLPTWYFSRWLQTPRGNSCFRYGISGWGLTLEEIYALHDDLQQVRIGLEEMEPTYDPLCQEGVLPVGDSTPVDAPVPTSSSSTAASMVSPDDSFASFFRSPATTTA